MSARKARTEAAAAGAAPVDSEEKDVKIPVEAADVTEANEAEAAEAAENQPALSTGYRKAPDSRSSRIRPARRSRTDRRRQVPRTRR